MKKQSIYHQFVSVDPSEIKLKIVDLSKQLFDLRMKLSVRTLDKTHKIKDIRKDIARLNTLLSHK